MVITAPGGIEENSFAVWGPTHHIVCSGVIGEAFRFASRGGNNVDIFISVVLAGESDHCAVRRKDWVSLDADTGRQAAGVAAIAGDNPQVAGIVEDDLRFADAGLAEKQRRVRFGKAGHG